MAAKDWEEREGEEEENVRRTQAEETEYIKVRYGFDFVILRGSPDSVIHTEVSENNRLGI